MNDFFTPIPCFGAVTLKYYTINYICSYNNKGGFKLLVKDARDELGDLVAGVGKVACGVDVAD